MELSSKTIRKIQERLITLINSDDFQIEICQELILEVLADADNPLTKKEIRQKVDEKWDIVREMMFCGTVKTESQKDFKVGGSGSD